jgi:hypothetical protein
MVHPGGPRRLGAAFRFLHPPPPSKQHCKMQSARPPRPPAAPARPAGGYIGLPPRRLRGRGDPGACGRGPRWRRLLAHAPPAAQAPSQAAGGAGGRGYERAHTRRGRAPRPPPPTRRRDREGRERDRQREGRACPPARRAALVQRGKPKYQFQTLGKHSAPRAPRMRTPPRGGAPARSWRRPRPRRIHAPHRPGSGGGGQQGRPHGGVALSVTFTGGEGRGGDSEPDAGTRVPNEAKLY